MVRLRMEALFFDFARAAAFLRRMADHAAPASDLLQEAAGLYEQVGRTNVWPWRAKHYMADEVKQGVASRELRRDFASAIRQAGAKEAQAVTLLERALAMLDQTH